MNKCDNGPSKSRPWYSATDTRQFGSKCSTPSVGGRERPHPRTRLGARRRQRRRFASGTDARQSGSKWSFPSVADRGMLCSKPRFAVPTARSWSVSFVAWTSSTRLELVTNERCPSSRSLLFLQRKHAGLSALWDSYHSASTVSPSKDTD